MRLPLVSCCCCMMIDGLLHYALGIKQHRSRSSASSVVPTRAPCAGLEADLWYAGSCLVGLKRRFLFEAKDACHDIGGETAHARVVDTD